MNFTPIASSLGLLAILLAGCTSIEPARHFGSRPIQSYKTAYVVLNEDTDEEIGAAIRDALLQHGVRASAGPVASKPRDTQFYVDFVDHWGWDLTMYLRSLDVRFIDNATGSVIATCSYRPRGHGYPDRKATAMEVVDKIYAPPEAAESR